MAKLFADAEDVTYTGKAVAWLAAGTDIIDIFQIHLTDHSAIDSSPA